MEKTVGRSMKIFAGRESLRIFTGQQYVISGTRDTACAHGKLPAMQIIQSLGNMQKSDGPEMIGKVDLIEVDALIRFLDAAIGKMLEAIPQFKLLVLAEAYPGTDVIAKL